MAYYFPKGLVIQIPPNQDEISRASALDTRTKAVTLNRDNRIYGTIAEIGAGQEIAGWFFKVGGASGTVAKTMSAYDMKVSDDIYGKATRYVSEARLTSMLDHEYSLLNERLGKSQGNDRTFFALANTVAARNFKGTNECHGWLGVRFQRNPNDEPSDIILHVNMHDPENFLQQQAVGILGVNLIYAAFFLKDNLEAFCTSLLDDLKPGRIEVDVAYFKGPYFKGWDDHLVGVHLIEDGLADAVLFSPEGKLVQPSSRIRKKPVLVERGTYRILNELLPDTHSKAFNLFNKQLAVSDKEPIIINEVSIRSVHHQQILSTKEIAELLPKLLDHNCYVMISDFSWYYSVSQYLRRHTQERISFIMGVSTLMKLFSDEVYDSESGNLLEALGKLLAIGVNIISYPMDISGLKTHLTCTDEDLAKWKLPKDSILTATDIEPKGPEKHLYRYLLESDTLLTIQ
jgi:hypothetical protein